jgi:hypothetical protein
VWCVSDGHDDEAVGTSELGLAERVGIEPTVPLPGQQFSRLPDSATLAPLRLVESIVIAVAYEYFPSVTFTAVVSVPAIFLPFRNVERRFT